MLRPRLCPQFGLHLSQSSSSGLTPASHWERGAPPSLLSQTLRALVPWAGAAQMRAGLQAGGGRWGRAGHAGTHPTHGLADCLVPWENCTPTLEPPRTAWPKSSFTQAWCSRPPPASRAPHSHRIRSLLDPPGADGDPPRGARAGRQGARATTLPVIPRATLQLSPTGPVS